MFRSENVNVNNYWNILCFAYLCSPMRRKFGALRQHHFSSCPIKPDTTSMNRALPRSAFLFLENRIFVNPLNAPINVPRTDHRNRFRNRTDLRQ